MKHQAKVGPNAGAFKYDILTMISIAGLHSTATFQTSMLRLVALVTARYNWRQNELTVGQRDIARMWAVNERTVKREMKRLTEAGVLICKRGGVRGRVGAYRLNEAQIAELSEPAWESVGPDFAYRMRERYAASEPKIVPLDTYRRPQIVPSDDPWGRMMAHLSESQPDVWSAWFAKLQFVSCDNGVLNVNAPNTFQRRYIETHLIDVLATAASAEMGPIDRITFGG